MVFHRNNTLLVYIVILLQDLRTGFFPFYFHIPLVVIMILTTLEGSKAFYRIKDL